jgi:hypothetical protein
VAFLQPIVTPKGTQNPHPAPYPIFLGFLEKALTVLKNKKKPHFNPLRIEYSGLSGKLHTIFGINLA